MTRLNARGKVTLLSSIFIFVLAFVASITRFHNLNLTRYNERVKGHIHAFELSVQLVAEKLSFGYFQWTEFYDAVTEEKADFIQENFDEILDRSKYISSIELIDRPESFQDFDRYYSIYSENGRLFILFNVYDDFVENVLKDRVIKCELDLETLLKLHGLTTLVDIVNEGKPFAFGLHYKIKQPPLRFFHFVSSVAIAFLMVLIIRSIINREIHIYYQTDGLKSLVWFFEQRDKYTVNHSKKVAMICMFLGKALGLRRKKLKKLYNAALLHDIGKIGIPESILNKKGKLTSEEFEIVKKHPEIGANVIGKIHQLQDLAPIILYHHERTDGSGYPEGLSKDRIPLLARILAVADVFDALVSDRPYRPGMTPEEAIRIMENMALDQDIVKVLRENLEEIMKSVNSLLVQENE
ncbi:HD-GYP domain-containing protein [Kosmotoga olearia]|uniref:Metal dependent phosphohydrolase n=1 Tax=Kosmotoga olearia (strain ATCC BAA-1733 / DSM 21960 / TBF 19.5.1) TaxID=521045 RepID=C5CJ16_KOSOT|nr:HD-GYP domain-containing protein [Kosmotoga olearia]ACR79932.1 metal dependent phosphohydrolase [Kosmotoga olearia TBF 19.5.1]